MFKRSFHFIFLSLFIGFTACSGSSSTTAVQLAKEAYQEGPPEQPECVSRTLAGATINVSGKATFHARQIFDDGGGRGGLGPAPGKEFPIRFAEIQVLQPDGSIAQCGQTDANGLFSLSLQQSTQPLTLSILSRTPVQDSHAHVSVMNRPSLNQLYSLQTVINPSANVDVGVLDAAVTGDLLGGAFNIMDQIIKANEFLRSTAGHCSQFFTGCDDFVVAPKVSVYWAKGFDPGSYFGDGAPLSFYLPHFSRLFILGGVNGDADLSDTDQFDNSVIIHEYAHFLEDNVFATSSPGGSHNGDRIIDPRLAWSEGWADFFQAAVLGDARYRDTFGNADGITGFAYDADLETPHFGNDYPGEIGEGNYREFSVARFLWDTLDNSLSETRFGFTDDVHDRFVEIWAALNRRQHGFRDPNYGFLNVGRLHESQTYAFLNDGLHNGTDFTQVRGLERHIADTSTYGQYVEVGSCDSYKLTPVEVPGDDGSFEMSDLFRNNRFYYLKVTTPLSGILELNYQDADGVGQEADLDLYLYNESAHFGDRDDFIGTSRRNPDHNPATPESEAIALNQLPPGKYLINVHVHTSDGIGGPVHYQLKLNGSSLCPAQL